MTYLCSRGHQSEDADYCSECGLRIVQGGASAPAAEAVACPDCGTPRQPGARFCEVCRHDFAGAPAAPVTAPAPSAPPVAPPPPAVPPPAAPAPQAPSASPFYGRAVWAVVTAERELLGGAADPAFPEQEPQRSYPLDFEENLVGRRSGRSGVHPEIPVSDPSASSRHCKLCRRPAGMVVVDLGSTNGTKVNGVDAPSGVEVAVRPGDRIEIGAWTRIVLELR